MSKPRPQRKTHGASRRPLTAPFVVTVSLGVATGACKNPDDYNTRNPPEPQGQPSARPPGKLPTWDEIKSGHPEGATNPPSPRLIVARDGTCYKKWAPPFAGGTQDQVVDSCTTQKCGVQIECPERAKTLLAAASASAPASAPASASTATAPRAPPSASAAKK